MCSREKFGKENLVSFLFEFTKLPLQNSLVSASFCLSVQLPSKYESIVGVDEEPFRRSLGRQRVGPSPKAKSAESGRAPHAHDHPRCPSF